MSLRTKVLLTIVFTSLFLFIVSSGFMVFIFYKELDRKIDETYKEMYNLYKVLEHNSVGNHTYKKEVGVKVCRKGLTYLLQIDGLYVGRLNVENGICVFSGRKINSLLETLSKTYESVYFLLYNRSAVERLNEIYFREFFDRFLKGRTLLGDYILEGDYIPQVIKSIGEIKGYGLIGRLPNKKLVIEYPVIDINDIPVGRIVFVEDVSSYFKDFLRNIIIFGIYNLLLIGILFTVFYYIFNRIVRDISFLEKLASEFQSGNFQNIKLLEKKIRRGKSDEMERLKRAVYIMASELEELINQLQEDKEKLEEIAYKDPLTGLFNRRFFLEHAKNIFEQAKRYGTPFSVILMDIDNFKKINDTYGHDIGDIVIQELAEIIKGASRSSDIPARWGGEEFILLLPNTDANGARLVAERIRDRFKKVSVKVGNERVNTTVSVGVSQFSGQERLEDIIKEADEALYKAKRSGKDRVEVYTSE